MMELKHLEIPADKSKGLDAAEVDHSLLKIAALGACLILSAFGFGLYLRWYIASGDWFYLLLLWILASCFLAIFLLAVFFVKARPRANIIIFLASIGLFLGFGKEISGPLIVGAALACIILLGANRLGALELENMLKVKFWRVSKRTLPRAIMGLAFFVSAAYYANIQNIERTNPGGFFISQPVFEKIISPASPLVQKFIPEFDLSITTGEFIHRMAVSQIKSNPKFAALPGALASPLIQEVENGLLKQISQLIGAPINPRAAVSETLYNALLKKVEELPLNVRQAVPFIAAAILFFAIMSLSWLVRFFATLIAWFLYEVSMTFGFSSLLLESRSREVVILK